MASITYFKCKNCNRKLKPVEKKLAEEQGTGECAECQYRLCAGTRYIGDDDKEY